MANSLSCKTTSRSARNCSRAKPAFKPAHWTIKIQPVFNINYVRARETGVIAPDPRGIDRGANPPPPIRAASRILEMLVACSIPALILRPTVTRGASTLHDERFLWLQEYFAEVHLVICQITMTFSHSGPATSFSIRIFRGFIFNDVNFGARLFATSATIITSTMPRSLTCRERNTFSDLNSFDQRNQRVFIASLYKQDFLWKGYTAQLSFHANLDDEDRHYDAREISCDRRLSAPSKAMTCVPITSAGRATDMSVGSTSRTPFTSTGTDDFNGLAGQPAEINAQWPR